MICFPHGLSFYVTGRLCALVYNTLDVSKAYVCDIVCVSGCHCTLGICVCVRVFVCISCQMGVYDSTAGGITARSKSEASVALKNTHKHYNTATKASSDHSSFTAPLTTTSTLQQENISDSLLTF